MNSPFFLFCTITMISRLLFEKESGQGKWYKYGMKTVFELLPLFIYQWRWSFLFFILFIIMLNGFLFYRSSAKQRETSKIITLMLYLLFYSFQFNGKAGSMALASWALNLGLFLQNSNFFLRILWGKSWEKTLIIMTALIFLTQEANYLIRHLITFVKVGPVKANKPDLVELRRGKVIGFLERILIFIFIINSSLSSVGFILAAKGLSRFKELDNRDFAEYFLIGTLLSSSAAVVTALLLKGVL